ncbi:MAG: sugar phosphate isomerase/epimerase family protein [bacterium]
MELKLGAGLWVFGNTMDRFCTKGYKEPIGVMEMLELAGKVKGLKGIEVHQSDFEEVSVEEFKKKLQDLGLVVSVVNVNVWGSGKWKYGAFTHRDPKLRREAIDEAKKAVDYARQLGAPSAGLWLGSDGFDYPFQVDYITHWNLLIDGIREVAEYAAPDIKVGIEYKLKEPRTHMSISDAGKALAIVLALEMENVGVVIDFGHALMSGENPADSVAFLARYGKLFNVHFNDAYGLWDDDMIVGSIRVWETIEFLLYCKLTNYQGWLTLDMFPYREDAVAAADMALRNIEAMWELVNKIDIEELKRAQETMDAVETQKVIRKLIFK